MHVDFMMKSTQMHHAFMLTELFSNKLEITLCDGRKTVWQVSYAMQ